MADENDTSQSASVNGKNTDSGAPCEEPQWVSVLQPDLLELDKHTLSTLQSLPPGTIVLEPGKSSIPGSADVVASDGDGSALHGFYLRPVMLNDNQNDIPTVFARSQDRGLDNDEASGSNQELSLVSFREGGNAELCESDNKNANHVSISTRGDLEGALRLDGSLLIKDDNLNDHQTVDASWGQEPNPVILLPKTEGYHMVDVGVRVQNDPWLATFEDNGLQKSPSGRVLEAVPEELSPLVEGGGEKIGDYLEAEDHEGGNSSPPQITVSEDFKVPKSEPGMESTEETIVITPAAKITTRTDSEGSSNLPHQKGTYLSHLPVKKRKMDNNFTVANSGSQLVSTDSVPQVSMVAVSSIASPLVLPASSMTASSLLLSALTAVPKTGKNSGAGLTTGLCVNTATGLLEPVKSSSNILKLVSGTGQASKVGSPMTVVMTSLPAEGTVPGTAMTSASEDHQDSRTESEALPCADNPNFVATFCCTYCQAELETWEQAQSHKFTHQLEASPGTFYVRYLCTPCGASFDTWEDAQDHSADNAAMPLVTCNVCSCLVPANNMYDHITRHTKQTPEKLSTKLAVQVLKLQKDEANLNLTPQSKNSNSFASSSSSSSSSSSAASSANSSSLEHLPLSKKLELQTALLQADIKRFRVLRKTIKKVQKQSSTSSSSSSSAPAAASSPSMLTKGPGNP